MYVFKFGGASVKNPSALKNVVQIIRSSENEKKIIIVSAIGNTTNKLEKIFECLKTEDDVTFRYLVNELYRFHVSYILELFSKEPFSLLDFMEKIFVQLGELIEEKLIPDLEDLIYDKVVSSGELFSSKILETYLSEISKNVLWLDTRQLILTDSNFKNAQVDWNSTIHNISQQIESSIHKVDYYIAPGFIASNTNGATTTIGREGSDYTAAIFAHCINAKQVTIWKDVPGMLNADPKWFDETIKLPHISFQEAIELAYYGANVIHPKTIKPLQNKNIPLYVKSFIDPTLEGTIIDTETKDDTLIPSFIFKMNQLKISITPKDFSFIAEEKLSQIFNSISSVNAHINLMQNSAISFDFVIDNKKGVRELLTKEFEHEYTISFKDELELVTIRHYDQETIQRVILDKEIILTQQTKHTTRMLMRDLL